MAFYGPQIRMGELCYSAISFYCPSIRISFQDTKNVSQEGDYFEEGDLDLYTESYRHCPHCRHGTTAQCWIATVIGELSERRPVHWQAIA